MDPPRVGAREQHPGVEGVGELDVDAVEVRMRHTDRVDAAEFGDPPGRFVVEQRDAVPQHVSAGCAHQQGALANRVDQLLERKADTGLQLADERSGLEDTDIQAVVARLGAQQLSLQAAQAVFARVNQSTLFDILR